MNDRLEIFTLGNLAIHHKGKLVVNLASRKAEALLVYLAANPRPHPRETLAEMLWDERSQSQAMANLRVVLSSLRKDTGEFVTITRANVAINPQADVWLDMIEFEDSLGAAKDAGGALTPDGRGLFEQALALYKGEFLEGFSLREASRFEAWQRNERERLRTILVRALQDRVEECLDSGQYRLGLSFTQRVLQFDPLIESIQNQMVRLLAYSGQRESALDQYEQYAGALQKELGIEPSHAMRDLYERLLEGNLTGPAASASNIGREPRAVGACPYRGLAAFREADASFFFGRETFIEQLQKAIQGRAFITVILGSSGVGKSSLVYAGLLPGLRSENWLIVLFRPGGLPFASLAGALLPYLEPGLSETERLIERGVLAAAWRDGDLGLAPVLERISEKNHNARRLLLVADQFEELFTLCPQPELRRRFLDLLIDAFAYIDRPGSRSGSHLLITLRADFTGQALAHRPFADTLQEGMLLLGPMNRAELQAAIEEPAKLQGVEIEAGLAGRILNDVGDEPGNLPLLEFTLTLLWDRLEQGWMTHAAYESISGVQGALAGYADEVYNQLEEVKQARLRGIMIQLVQPGQGTEDTRRVGLRDEFDPQDWDLIRLLADKRLVVTGRSEQEAETVEVVHEALIQHWGRLREWMVIDRDFRRWQENLRAAMRGWEASDRDPGGLLRGGPLSNAEEWQVQRGSDLSKAEREYVQASLSARAARRAAEREQREREKALVRLATSRELAAEAINSIAEDQERAVLLAVHALELERTHEAVAALRKAAGEYRLLRSLHEPERFSIFTISPDEGQLVLSGSNGAAFLDLGSGEIIHRIDTDDIINQTAYSPDGKILALSHENGINAGTNGTISLLDTVTKEVLCTFHAHDAWVQCLAFNPQGTFLASGSGSGNVRVWELSALLAGKSAQPRLDLDSGGNIVWQVNFSPDGSILAASCSEDARMWAQLWDTGNGKVLFRFEDTHHIAFSLDGEFLFSGSTFGALEAFDLFSGRSIARIQAHENDIKSIRYNPGTSRLASAGSDSVIKIWHFEKGTFHLLYTLTGHKRSVSEIDFSSSGNHVVSISRDETIKIWDLSPNGSLEPIFYTHLERVESVFFHPRGDHLATASFDGTAKIWDAQSLELLHTLKAHKGGVNCIKYSADGSILATGGDDGTARLWDPVSGRELSRLECTPKKDTYPFKVLKIDFDPNTERIATAGGDGFVRVWEVKALLQDHLELGTESLALDARLMETEPWKFVNRASSVKFSPDGALIAACSEFPIGSNVVKVWDASSGKLLCELGETPHEAYCSLAFSPNGRRLAAGDSHGIATVWDLPDEYSGAPTAAFTIHAAKAWLTALSFSPDGKRLALSQPEGLGVWNAGSGELIETFPHPVSALDAAFSPDGNRIAICGSDGRVRLFHLDVDELLAHARARLTRDLTPEECRKYLHTDECL